MASIYPILSKAQLHRHLDEFNERLGGLEVTPRGLILPSGDPLQTVGTTVHIHQGYGEKNTMRYLYTHVPTDAGGLHFITARLNNKRDWSDTLSFTAHPRGTGEGEIEHEPIFFSPRHTAQEPYGSFHRDPRNFTRRMHEVIESAPSPRPEVIRENQAWIQKMVARGTTVEHDEPYEGGQKRYFHFNVGTGELKLRA